MNRVTKHPDSWLSEDSTDDTLADRVAGIIDALSIEQKVGQLFLLAFPGKDPVTVLSLIQHYRIGGCYISQDNAETFDEAKSLSEALQRGALACNPDLPLLLGADQEGAWGVMIPEATIGPGNLALGAADDPELTYKMYAIFADEMLSVGYQAVLGPCSDINLNPKNPIIGTRSFGASPQRVAQHVAAAVQAIRDHGAISAAKHFPGHGDTQADSHREIPIVNKPLLQLLTHELLPFQSAINAGVDMVMTSHILFPQIDPVYPATLSAKILTGLLRNVMGFRGLIITDSMNMGAMRYHFSVQEATRRALQAGADIIMLAEEHYEHSSQYLKKQIASIESVVTAVKQGEISLPLIEDRLSRIIRFKLSRLGKSVRPEKASQLDRTADQATYRSEVAHAAAQSATKLMRYRSDVWPIDIRKSIAIVNATPRESYTRLMNSRGIGPNQQTPAFDSFHEELRLFCPHAALFSYETIHTNLDLLAEHDSIIAVTEDYPLPGEDFSKTAQTKLMQELVNRFNDKLLVVGLRGPYEIEDFPDVACYLSTHSSRTCSAKAAAQLIAGHN